MPALYLLKTVIWVFCAVVTLQGLSLVARRVLFLSGQEEYSPGEPGQPHHTPEESV
jgi:TRAP-type mannitol/chloroaromatic compound transport system permease small subunit